VDPGEAGFEHLKTGTGSRAEAVPLAWASADGLEGAALVYCGQAPGRREDAMFWTSEFFWKVFQRTGAAWAYVVYRRLRRAHAYARFLWN